MKKKPLTAKQLFDEGEKIKKQRRKSINDKILDTIDILLLKGAKREDIVNVLSNIINKLTK